jgi:type I restriction-modification system DNA methylase subunit
MRRTTEKKQAITYITKNRHDGLYGRSPGIAIPRETKNETLMANKNGNGKSLESWIWDAACSIRGAKDAPKYKDYILPLIFTKRLCDVFDDELNRIAAEVGSRRKAFQLARADHKLVRFYLPLVPDDFDQPVWSVIRMLSSKIGESLTSYMRGIARENPLLQGIIDRVDFNATTHGQSAGEFYTPPEVGAIMSRVLQPEPGMEIYDPTCGSGGLLVKCEIAMEEKRRVPLHPHRRGRNLPAHRRNSRGAERHRRGSQSNRQCPAGNSQAVGGGGMKIALQPKKHRNFAP